MTVDELRAHLMLSPFIRSLGLEIAAADADASTLTMRLPWRDDGQDADGRGTWHGGPIAALIDTAGAFAATMVAGRDCGTVSMLVDYLRPARGELVARAIVRKTGRTLSNVDVEICDVTGKVCALGRGTFFVSAAT
jgi:uncharacterized protein (TIGR00369 family)